VELDVSCHVLHEAPSFIDRITNVPISEGHVNQPFCNETCHFRQESGTRFTAIQMFISFMYTE